MTDKLREAIAAAQRCNLTATCIGGPSFLWLDKAHIETLVRAAESTLPKTKMVEVWQVEYCFLDPDLRLATRIWYAEHEARRYAESLSEEPEKYLCIRSTGPHQREVPA